MTPIIELDSFTCLQWKDDTYLIDTTTDLIIDTKDPTVSCLIERRATIPFPLLPFFDGKRRDRRKVYIGYVNGHWEIVLDHAEDIHYDVEYDPERLVVYALNEQGERMGLCHIGQLKLLNDIRHGKITKCYLDYSPSHGMFQSGFK